MYKDEDQIEEERFYETRDLFSELQVQLEELDVGSIWRYKGMLEPWYQVCEGRDMLRGGEEHEEARDRRS